MQKRLNQILMYQDIPAAVQSNLNIVCNTPTATQAALQEANSCLEDDVFMGNGSCS